MRSTFAAGSCEATGSSHGARTNGLVASSFLGFLRAFRVFFTFIFNPQSHSVFSNAVPTSPGFGSPSRGRQTRNRATLVRRRPSIPSPSGALMRAKKLHRTAGAQRLRGLELLCFLQGFLCHFFLPLICPSGAMPCYMQSARQSCNALVPSRKCREIRMLPFSRRPLHTYNHSKNRSRH